MKNRKNHDALRVVRLCQRISEQKLADRLRGTRRSVVWATKLWNAIDHVDCYADPEGLWDIMAAMLPWAYVNGRFQFEYWQA